MQITTSKGKTFDIRAVAQMIRHKNRVLVEFADDRALADVATDFDGIDGFRKFREGEDGIYEVYEGFSKLVSVQRNEDEGTVRVTLERGDGNG